MINQTELASRFATDTIAFQSGVRMVRLFDGQSAQVHGLTRYVKVIQGTKTVTHPSTY